MGDDQEDKTHPGRQVRGGHALLHGFLLMLQEGQGPVDPVVLVAMVFPPVEQAGQSDQNPAEAELKVAQHVDGEDDGEGFAKLDPHVHELRQRGLLLLQLIWRRRWSGGGAH